MTHFRVARFFALLFITLVGLLPLTAAGQAASVDLSFNPIPSNPLPTDANFQQVVQPDGKVIVGGDFPRLADFQRRVAAAVAER